MNTTAPVISCEAVPYRSRGLLIEREWGSRPGAVSVERPSRLAVWSAQDGQRDT